MSNIKLKLRTFVKNITKSNLAITITSNILYYYSRLIYYTTSWKIINREPITECLEKGESFILIGWHGRAMMLPAFGEHRYHLDALVSLHNDGRIIAGVLKKYGIGIIGGSTNKNARGAAVHLMNSLKDNKSICIIPDGPRGPRMKMSMSPIYYAHKTGKPIFGITYSCSHSKIAESAWDKMMLPLPFGRGIYIITEPIYIPTNATEEELEGYRQRVEDILNQISYESDRQVGIDPITPSDRAKFQFRPQKTAKGK